ncbi:MAG: cytochrome b N-terminal domain-containing protein [Thermoleophilia bacterium]|nr:cytochrome b N-terminal domain-containing protein [Thermoleophilia bacterium]
MAGGLKEELKYRGEQALDQVDQRGGLVEFHKWFLFRRVPKGLSWLHTLGFCLLIVFVNQAVTGSILAMYYQPGANTAYESIQRIMFDFDFGWLVRGMHKWGASAMIVLMFLHMAASFMMGAYKYPRELTWITGVLIFAATLGMGLTGYLLVWDQRAFWASVVAINLNGTAPFLGPYISEFLRGGAEYTGDILPRFYALHMLLIPGGLMGLIGLHMYLVTRLGVTPAPWKTEDPANDPEAWS